VSFIVIAQTCSRLCFGLVFPVCKRFTVWTSHLNHQTWAARPGRALFTLQKEKDWAHDMAAAADVALLGRSYERFADRTVEIGHRVVLRAAGEAPTCEVRQSSRCDHHTFGASKVGKHVNPRLLFLSQLLRQSELAVSDTQAISAVLF
jgi:hypothetical protein